MSTVASLLILSVLLICAAMADATEPSGESPPSTDDLPGHMQPLGSHMEPKLVERIKYMPTPQQFNDDYVSKQKPVVFEGLMKDLDVLKNWQSDDYLRDNFGNDMMGMETGKKENRSLYGFEIKMSEYLDLYKQDDIYMVSDLSAKMYEEWALPRFMTCGGYTQHLALTFLWFSSGGTKSVLHTDTNENLHCLVSGTKKFVMFKPYFADTIGSEHYGQGFYNIDVERVNMTEYPNLAKIPWHLATLKSGDCLYLPYLWIHHVDSTGRNMGVNVWWNQFEFQPESCPIDPNDVPEFTSLANFEFETVTDLKKMFDKAQRKDGTVHASDLLTEELRLEGVDIDHLEGLLDEIEPGCNGVLVNIHKLSKTALRRGALYFTDLFNLHANSEDNLQPLHEEEEVEDNSEGEEQEHEATDVDNSVEDTTEKEDLKKDEL